MSRAPRIVLGVSILTLVVSAVGFVVVIVLNVFILDEFDAYGEVAIPGSGSLQLPEGEVTISFRTVVTGRPTGGGLPVPKLQMSINPPAGVAEPEVTESFGGTTTVNNDAHVRIWVLQIPQAGTYDITTDGNVNGYIAPRLAFGHDNSVGWPLWLFGGLFAIGLLGLLGSLVWAARVGKKARPVEPDELVTSDESTWDRAAPAEQGNRFEQLRTLKQLRDSGTLSDEEFEAEKRRILNS